jgi:hypothetical protein
LAEGNTLIFTTDIKLFFFSTYQTPIALHNDIPGNEIIKSLKLQYKFIINNFLSANLHIVAYGLLVKAENGIFQ